MTWIRPAIGRGNGPDIPLIIPVSGRYTVRLIASQTTRGVALAGSDPVRTWRSRTDDRVGGRMRRFGGAGATLEAVEKGTANVEVENEHGVSDLLDGNPLAQVASGYTFTEGPVWIPAHNRLIFSDIPTSTAHS